MNIEQSVLEKLRLLPTAKQQEVLDFVEFLGQKHIPERRPRRNWIGTATDLSVDLTEEDIAEARRETWRTFPERTFNVVGRYKHSRNTLVATSTAKVVCKRPRGF